MPSIEQSRKLELLQNVAALDTSDIVPTIHDGSIYDYKDTPEATFIRDVLDARVYHMTTSPKDRTELARIIPALAIWKSLAPKDE